MNAGKTLKTCFMLEVVFLVCFSEIEFFRFRNKILIYYDNDFL